MVLVGLILHRGSRSRVVDPSEVLVVLPANVLCSISSLFFSVVVSSLGFCGCAAWTEDGKQQWPAPMAC